MKRWRHGYMVSIAVFLGVGIMSAVGIAVGYGHATLNSYGSAAPPRNYVAMGDSVAAGDGLPPSSPSGHNAACVRSSLSYPSVLGAKLHTTTRNVACNGAKDSDGIIGDMSIGSATVPSQLDQAFKTGVPDLMTITIGANDIGWIQLMSKCYIGTCGTLGDTKTAAARLTAFQDSLASTLRAVKDRSGTHEPPTVLVTGYYEPIGTTSCFGGQLTSNELTWIHTETNNLNNVIRRTVAVSANKSSLFKGASAFAKYVPISFKGHGVCSPTPWVQGPGEAAPLHPNSEGAAEIANALYKVAI